MERRMLLAVSLVLLFLAGFQLVMRRLYPPPEEPLVRETPREEVQAAPILQPQHSAPQPEEPEQTQRLETLTTTIDIGTYGGTVVELSLPAFTDPDTQQPTVLTHPQDHRRRLGFFDELLINGTRLYEPVYVLSREGAAVVARAHTASGIELVKRYQFDDTGRLLGEVHITNATQAPATLTGSLTAVPPLAPASKDEERYLHGLLLDGGRLRKIAAGKARKTPITHTGPHEVAGQVNRYFAFLAAWNRPASQVVFKSQEGRGLQAIAAWGPVMLQPGFTHTEHFMWYVGSQDYAQIAATDTRFARLFPQGLFGTIGFWLLACLRFFARVTHSYGAAILLLTATVSLLMFPLGRMGLRMSRDAMAQMRALQPKLEQLKARYKDNPQKLNKETMELYKKSGINPLSQVGGCLPLLLQFPVFISLYQTLLSAVELRGASFLWIQDLSAPDRLFVLGNFPVNILPILWGGLMFLQQKLSPMQQQATTPGMPNMGLIFAVVFPAMFYNMQSGLLLYIFTSSLFMLGQHVAMRQPAT